MILVMASCGGDSTTNVVCSSGATQACSCEGGMAGTQACKGDGSGFASCVCSTGPDAGPSCAEANGGCDANATCALSAGTISCTCRTGYQGDGVSCTDVDECQTNNGGCDANATCTNTPGSRTCVCKAGYQGDGLSCTDVDECETENGGCDANATCTNTAGSVTCDCKAGYQGDGATCADVDECETDNGGCDVNAACTNTAGSMTCACKAGYQGDGATCADIDECETDNGGCGANATCANTPGSRTCVCHDGFHDGGTGACVATGECSSGYHDGGTGSCVTIATCSPGYHNGGTGTCVALGSCSTGYHDGGTGICVILGTCSSGHHDGGDGACVDNGTCSSGFHTGGNGVCVPEGTCSTGYHDGGTGTCVANGRCSTGYHDGGDGACVANGSCSVGYHTISGGVCVASYASVAIRTHHTCATLASGSARCWGFNSYGQVGDGTTDSRRVPADVKGLTAGVSAVEPGMYHSCALLKTGAVKCWGHNYGGQVGDGTTTDRSLPADVVGLGTSVSAISVGNNHSCALLATGGVKCWGQAGYGQLGNGGADALVAVDVSGLTAGVAAISAGGDHACALLTTGGVKCWGNNDHGQLGDGTTTRRVTPVDVNGLPSDVSAIASGTSHTCALLTTGGVKCWGNNDHGQLGDGTITQQLTPVDVSGLTAGVSAVSAGSTNTCALLTTGGLKCWGKNDKGQVGDGTTTSRPTAVNVAGLTSGVSAVSVGDSSACSLLTTGVIKCWGDNSSGQLGDGTYTTRLTPTSIWVTVPYGQLATIDFASPYIFDEAQFANAGYWQAHPSGLLRRATFTGWYTAAGTPIPPVAGVTANYSFALHSAEQNGQPAGLYVKQQSESSTSVLSPVILLVFPTDFVSVGMLEVGMGLGRAELYLANPSTGCIAAMAVGNIEVTEATDTNLEGGSLAFRGSGVPLYHPSSTPNGDMTAAFVNSGWQVCPR